MGKKTTYSKEFKLRAVKMYLEGDSGYLRICKELGIPDTKTIRLWVKNYRTTGMAGLEERRGKTKRFQEGQREKGNHTEELELQRLRAENAFLKKLLAFQRR